MNYCIATHPDKPNDTANTRGRKYHLTIDDKLTICKNVVTHLIGAKDDVWHSNGDRKSNLMWAPASQQQGLCGNCKNIANQKRIEYKLMDY